eukprot:CAMPEP_0113599760 /NCGR_PEP_ID=MMETSP0015_2-20120614/42329_1 /TAXON_ID=2838 /ORGANISM="Odontella" /LENGTH=618 /DNA_ID=CAMNT_0000507939 /DNA_START=30 /DNA_END=1886 /DNA_ORIENTATION=+ /assembly_acc=CAM_ASM_000160
MAAKQESASRLRRRRHHRLLLLVAALVAGSGRAGFGAGVEAYVTSGLPGHKHRSWLKQMTREIVDAPPGELTAHHLAAAPQLMTVWAENPYVPSGASRWSPPQLDLSTSPPSSKRPRHPSSSGPCSPGADHGLECALEVEALLKRLVDERFAAGRDDVNVTTEVYNAVLFGWANSGKGAFAAERAEQILMQMQQMYETGDGDVRPDVQSFRAVLLAWSNAARNAVSHGERRSDEKCQAAQRAERVLEYMAHLDGDSLLDADCFEVVLRLWSNSGLPNAPLRAERLLAVQDTMYLIGNEKCRLRASSFDEVLMAWCRHNYATTNSKSDKGDGKVGRVHDDLAAEAPRRAETILAHMEHLSDNGAVPDTMPNLASYTSVVSAWGRSGGQRGAHRATQILKRLEKRYFEKRSQLNKATEAGDNKLGVRVSKEASDLRPDTTIYNVCIDAWVKSHTKDAYRRARSILNRQIAAHATGIRRCRPDVYSYTLVLHACAAFAGTMKEKRKPFRVAKATYEQLLDAGNGVAPNHVTYGIMMKACARLLPKGSHEREQFAREVFERACGEGRVGKMVVCRLREAVSAEVYKEMMGKASKNRIPSKWTRYVPEAEKRQLGRSVSTKDS